MRIKIAGLLAKVVLFILGVILLVAAIFAVQLGLDNDAGWGKGRIALAIFGIACLVGSSAIHFSKIFARLITTFAAWYTALCTWIKNTGVGKRFRKITCALSGALQRSTFIQHIKKSSNEHAGLSTLSGVIISLILAVWFFTAGRMTIREPNTYYFDQLAQGFLASQLSLIEPPSEQLLAMTDPYDWKARSDQQIPFIWDTSLYNQKYYLYWGPVPALLAAAVKSVFRVRIYDASLVFSFYSGILIICALILMQLRRRFFPRSPAWLLGLLVIMIGITAPLLYLVNHPNVYETAISGGQFFLLVGIYCLLNGTDQKSRHFPWLVTAGVFWGLAVGCRATLAVAVGVMTLIFAIYAIQTRKKGDWFLCLVSLGIPLVISAAGLAWYNWARFGSILETGVTYQLSGPAIPHPLRGITSLNYLVPNLYSYFFRMPIVDLANFPYIVTPFVSETMWPSFIRLPDLYYYPEPMIGILAAVPAVWLTGLPVLHWIKRLANWLREVPPHSIDNGQEKKFARYLLLTGSISALLPLLVFIAPMYRYHSDWFPMLGLFVSFCLWRELDDMASHPDRKRLILFIAVVLILLSILIGFFGSFIIGTAVFENRNPALYSHLLNIFK